MLQHMRIPPVTKIPLAMAGSFVRDTTSRQKCLHAYAPADATSSRRDPPARSHGELYSYWYWMQTRLPSMALIATRPT